MTIESLLIAVATVFWTKAQEKIGENIGDVLWNAPGQLIELLRRKNQAPSLTSDEPERLDYGQAVLELTQAAQDPEIAQAVVDVEAAVNNDKSEAAKEIKKLADEIKSHPSVVKNFTKMAETIKAEKGATVAQNIEHFTQNNTYN
ncbi:hypothetical protein [Trichormus variabilis]|uniref:Uncharacterized protein n=1 Tax=Trichormus variabilis NIES-23 TaxID=1973479 RepID=A0A1Z4KKM5_ANAVA|nr:hypothetical protein [Trichormus variabilis]MBD2348174.1 hypothetical protein [Trichormus variabilis FACHB-171]BAY69518.1 hypothetical protein NIES23_23120 [Trichormus variabilis NIES-23]